MTNKKVRRGKKSHTNDEETVRCPVEGCDKEVLRRALHLHVNRKVGDGHGKQGVIPEGVNLDEAETVGTEEVTMEYPSERDTESVNRLCPYCERPFNGKQAVMIHLGSMAGRKDHPENATEHHNMDDFAIVRVDNNQNIIEVVEPGVELPTSKRRRKESGEGIRNIPDEEIKEHIEDLRNKGLEEEAQRAETMLLGK